jgi:hypothetical protein
MVKRNLKIMTALAITLSLGLGFVTVHAATSSSTTSNTTIKVECKVGFCNPAYSILESKGFTKTQIDDAAKAGKTAFDLAKEKGMTADQLRSEIIAAKSKKIDQAVADGKITSEKAGTIKANLPTKIKEWDGSLKHHNGGHLKPIYSILESKGFTKTQIDEASKAGKTAFDLAKEKGMTADQLRSEIIAAKSKKIDELVSSGKISAEKAKTIKADFTNRMQKWDGSLTHKTDETKSN